jgi:hypothetical protein
MNKTMPDYQHHHRDHGNGPKKPWTWFGIILALVVAYGVGHSSGSNSSATSAAAVPASDPNSLADQSAVQSYPDYGSDSQDSDVASDEADTGPESASYDDDEPTISDASGDATYSGVCSGDYYQDSDGICVHRPVDADVAPSGATAQCNDGTYSFSQHHSGTCSHHGGVAAWL